MMARHRLRFSIAMEFGRFPFGCGVQARVFRHRKAVKGGTAGSGWWRGSFVHGALIA